MSYEGPQIVQMRVSEEEMFQYGTFSSAGFI